MYCLWILKLCDLAANRIRIPDGLYRIDTFYVLLPAYWSSRRRRSGMSGRQVAPLTEEAGTIDHLVMGDAPKARSQRFPPIRTADLARQGRGYEVPTQPGILGPESRDSVERRCRCCCLLVGSPHGLCRVRRDRIQLVMTTAAISGPLKGVPRVLALGPDGAGR